MNLRILKKLSKRAAPLLPLLGDRRQQFRAERGENYHGMHITARKHFERCPSFHTDVWGEGMLCIAPKCRREHVWPYIKLYPPSHPRKGTIMVGETTGYYEPEWEEECAYSALLSAVYSHFTDWEAIAMNRPERPEFSRDLRTPRQVFAVAHEMIQQAA